MSTSAWTPVDEGNSSWAPVDEKRPNVSWRDVPQPASTPPASGGFWSDTAKGIGEGLLQTGTSLSPLLNKIPLIGETLAPSAGIAAANQLKQPANATQAIAKGAEQLGEWLLPTGLEGKAGVWAAAHAPQIARIALPRAAQIARIAAPAARVAVSALESGVRNKLQGGDFTTGATVGGIGSGLGQAAATIAPRLARIAVGETFRDRLRGKAPGLASLTEPGITANSPAIIAQQAGELTGNLTQELNQAARQSIVPATVDNAVQMLDREGLRAKDFNSPEMSKKVNQLRNRITMDMNGRPFPSPTSAENVLNLKRGVGDLVTTWNPQENTKYANSIVQNLYGNLDQEVDRTVQGAGPLNDRISSLIALQDDAAKKAALADMPARVIGRIVAHTGALTAGGFGAKQGYDKAGIPGAVVGGAAGLLLPELVADPSLQMRVARNLYSPALQNVAVPLVKGLGLQIARPPVLLNSDDPSQ